MAAHLRQGYGRTLKAPGKPFNFEGLVRGVAAHDLYHAGQIQLLKALRS